MSGQDTVIRKMNWRPRICLCLFAFSAEYAARQIMGDRLLSQPSWNGEKWLGAGAKRKQTCVREALRRKGDLLH